MTRFRIRGWWSCPKAASRRRDRRAIRSIFRIAESRHAIRKMDRIARSTRRAWASRSADRTPRTAQVDLRKRDGAPLRARRTTIEIRGSHRDNPRVAARTKSKSCNRHVGTAMRDRRRTARSLTPSPGLTVRAMGTSRSIRSAASTLLRRANFRSAENSLRRLPTAPGSVSVPASVSAFPLAGTETEPGALHPCLA